MELAKSVPKSKKPMVKYSLHAQIKELTPDKGHILITSYIDWDFPHFVDRSKRIRKEIDFKYSDLGQFRKELALKIDSACEIFL
jgi:hypothetical protein